MDAMSEMLMQALTGKKDESRLNEEKFSLRASLVERYLEIFVRVIGKLPTEEELPAIVDRACKLADLMTSRLDSMHKLMCELPADKPKDEQD